MIEQGWICTPRPCSSDFVDSLEGHNLDRLEEYLEAINLEAVDQKGGETGGVTIFISYLVLVGL